MDTGGNSFPNIYMVIETVSVHSAGYSLFSNGETPAIAGTYTVKKRFTSFPSPAGMSLSKLPLGRNNSVMTSLFPPRESLVVTSRLGTGNSRSFFYGVSNSRDVRNVENKSIKRYVNSNKAPAMTETLASLQGRQH